MRLIKPPLPPGAGTALDMDVNGPLSVRQPYPQRAFAITLDGTLLRTSHLRLWVGHLLATPPGREAGRLKRLRILGCKALVGPVVALGTAGIISRAAMKRCLQRLARALEAGTTAQEQQARRDTLARALVAHVRPALAELIAALRARGELMILSTAAVADCAEPLARQLGLDAVCASSRADAAEWVHSIGGRKATATAQALRDLGAAGASLVVLADHLDDLPLIAQADLLCWFGPPDDVLTLHRFLRGGVRVVRARDMPPEALAAVLGLPPEAALQMGEEV